VSSHSVNNLRLQIAQVLALCGDTAGAVRRVPAGDQVARFFVTAHFESDLVHLGSSVSSKTRSVNRLSLTPLTLGSQSANLHASRASKKRRRAADLKGGGLRYLLSGDRAHCGPQATDNRGRLCYDFGFSWQSNGCLRRAHRLLRGGAMT